MAEKTVTLKIDDPINVLGEPLKPCSRDPMTGFFRDGCCNTSALDKGMHTVCVIITDEFLDFSKAAGNDLSTPMEEYGFPGLKAGDRWCLCAGRWAEADANGVAPLVALESTHKNTLDIVPLEILLRKAIDLN